MTNKIHPVLSFLIYILFYFLIHNLIRFLIYFLIHILIYFLNFLYKDRTYYGKGRKV